MDDTTQLDLWNFQIPDRFWWEDSGSEITAKVEMQDTPNLANQYGIYHDQAHMHPYGVVGLKIPTNAFCELRLVEKSRDDCFGSRNIVSTIE